MANLNFPSNPTLGQIHTAGSKSWVWNGVAWSIQRVAQPGKSAYEIAIEQGFVGTEAQWVSSLKGDKGERGSQGPKGDAGDRGIKGDQGDRGNDGTNGTNGTNGQGVPTGGSVGQVLTKNSNNPFDTSWQTPDYLSDYTVPLGGNQGQFLGKVSAADGDFEWLDIPSASPYDPELPAGGNQGQVLTKKSATTGDVEWASPSGGALPNGGTAGQILIKNSTFNGDATWQDLPAGGTGDVEEAPDDGKAYVRKNSAWYELTTADGDSRPVSNRWRINITGKTNSGSWIGLKEVKMREVPGGPNMAVGGIASAQYQDAPNNPASSAFDGDTNTQWATGTSQMPVWLEYQFTSELYVNEIEIMTSATAGDAMRVATVEYWDGGTWVPTWGINTGAWTGNEVRTFTNPSPQLPPAPSEPAVEEAPQDGKQYVRKDGAWVEASASVGPAFEPIEGVGTGSNQSIALPAGVTEDYQIDVYVNGLHLGIDEYAVTNGNLFIQTNAAGDKIEIRAAGGNGVSTGGGDFPEAPQDGKKYARQDGAWVEIIESTGGSSEGDPYYRMAGFFTTSPAVNEILMIYVVDVPVTIPANFSGSQSKLIGMQPQSGFTLSIRKNSTTEIGTLTVNTAGVSSFTTTDGTAKTLVAGDAISIHAPGVSDVISNLTWILRGNK